MTQKNKNRKWFQSDEVFCRKDADQPPAQERPAVSRQECFRPANCLQAEPERD